MRFSQILARFAVSLFTREWIEILVSSPVSICRKCLPLYEGADWNLAGIHKDFTSVQSPSLRGSGLKSVSQGRIRNPCSLPLYEGADWNLFSRWCCPVGGVSLFTRERIEIAQQAAFAWLFRVSLFTREWIEVLSWYYGKNSRSLPLTKKWIDRNQYYFLDCICF